MPAHDGWLEQHEKVIKDTREMAGVRYRAAGETIDKLRSRWRLGSLLPGLRTLDPPLSISIVWNPSIFVT